MNRWIALLLSPLALLALLAGCSPAASQQPTAAPFSGGARMDFDRRLMDFGDVQFDKPLTAAFTVKNVGDKPLVLQKVDLKLVQGC